MTEGMGVPREITLNFSVHPYRMSGNRIEVRTLNLDGDFDSIRSQLDGIARKYFGIKAV